VDEGRQALARVNGAANKLGDRLGESSPLVTAMANAVGDDLGPKIAEALAQARALHDAAVSVNATLETLNSLGFVNVPTFTDELSAVSERVGGAQSDVQQLRAVSPTFGRIPGSAMWIFDTVGLTVFMACVGLAAGPSFFSGLQTSGISLVFVGLVIAILPHTVSILFGRYVLKMNPVIVLGACSGAGTITAALRAIQEEAESDLPALGYTVPYAIGNIVLTAWGPVLVAMMT